MSIRHASLKWIDAPSGVITIAALALWGVWPHVERVVPAVRPQPPLTTVAALRPDAGGRYLSPDVFALPSPMGFSGPGVRETMPDFPAAALPARPHYLPYAGLTAADPSAPPRRSPPVHENGPEQAMTVHPRRREELFAIAATPDVKVIVRPRGCLLERGFTLPPPPAAATNRAATAWQVSLRVDVNEAGMVEHVFLVAGSDEPAINGAVLRWVAQGRLAQPGARCRGRVTINAGTR